MARQIDARRRLRLTGTPLENQLGELWSLFDFLLPGLLDDGKQFRRFFRTSIEKHANEAAKARLARCIRPFLLRRAKAQAAALQSWFELCWRFPAKAMYWKPRTTPSFAASGSRFLELDPELPGESFPAWLLLDKPGLTRILPEPADDRPTRPVSYRIMYRLQHHRLSTRNGAGSDGSPPGVEDDVALRAALKREDPALFEYFLRYIQQWNEDT